MRVETPTCRYWFKASFPGFHAEPALSAYLDRELPGAVPPVIAHDIDERWMLLGDVGSDAVADHRDATPQAVRHLVGMQRSFIGRTQGLVVAGCRVRRLDSLCAEFAAVMADKEVSTLLDATAQRVTQLVDWLGDAVATIARVGMPDTLVHGDFHPGNIVRRDGGMVLFDWSDAAIANPFFDVVVWTEWLTDTPEQIDALWEMFIDEWADAIAPDEVRRLRPLLTAVAGAYHTVSYAAILAGVEPRRRSENIDGLTGFFALLDAAVPSGDG